MQRGATDYVIKDRLGRLVSSVKQALERRRSERERCRIEDALRSSEERFRQLADAMPQLVWTARADATVDYYNERFYQFTGCPRDQDPEQVWRSIIHPDDLERVCEAWAQSVRTGRPV